MKFLKYTVIAIFMFFAISCEDHLDTFPTDKGGGAELFSDIDKAFSTINGLYRAMYVTNWGTGWQHEQFGHTSINHVGNLMGEDMVQMEEGQGWFYYDYGYQVKFDYTNTAGRPYSSWNFYYTLITNVNSIIASKDQIAGEESKINSLIGQAYALRAFSYFNLARFYQQTYVGNEELPGVPIYTEPTTIETKGKGRGKLKDVYNLINTDIDQAIQLLNPEKAAPRAHISNLDYYSANGLKARIMLEQQRYQEAFDAANEALKGGTSLLSKTDIEGNFAFNDVSKNCVLWGFKIIDSQVCDGGYASIFGHLDSSVGGFYANQARVCISTWLYNQINDNDIRKRWWNGIIENEEPTGTQMSYNQMKFKFSNPSTGGGDYIFMRHAEMSLIKAEAACMMNNYSLAEQILRDFMAERYPDYDISTLAHEKTLTKTDSNGPTTPATGSQTLLDEIILQRRIELWGEISRIYDIKRLKTGFVRNFEGSNHTVKLSRLNTQDINCPYWVMAIPQAEFDGNEAMDAEKDQNPW